MRPALALTISVLLLCPQAWAGEAPAAEAEVTAGYLHVDQASSTYGVRPAVRDYATAGLTLFGRAEAGTLAATSTLAAQGAAASTGPERRGQVAATESLRVNGPFSSQSLSAQGLLAYDGTDQVADPLLDQQGLSGLTPEQRRRIRSISAGYFGSLDLDGRNSFSAEVSSGGQDRGLTTHTQTAYLGLSSERSAATTLRLGVFALRQSVGAAASGTVGPDLAASVQLSPVAAIDVRAGYRWARTIGTDEPPAATYDAGLSLRVDDQRTSGTLAFARTVGGAVASAAVDATQTSSAGLTHLLTRRARVGTRVSQSRTERLTGPDAGAGAESRAVEASESYGFGTPLPWKGGDFPHSLALNLSREDLDDGRLGRGTRLVLRLVYAGAFF